MIDCSKCPDKGSCCGPFQMDKEFVEKHKDKFQVENFKKVESGNLVAILCDDFRCIFLNRITNNCSIYEDRPPVCHMFGTDDKLPCPFFKRSGNPRSDASRKIVNKLYDKRINMMEHLA